MIVERDKHLMKLDLMRKAAEREEQKRLMGGPGGSPGSIAGAKLLSPKYQLPSADQGVVSRMSTPRSDDEDNEEKDADNQVTTPFPVSPLHLQHMHPPQSLTLVVDLACTLSCKMRSISYTMTPSYKLFAPSHITCLTISLLPPPPHTTITAFSWTTPPAPPAAARPSASAGLTVDSPVDRPAPRGPSHTDKGLAHCQHRDKG